MEANICCAYNASRSCKISSKVAVTDCANEPFKLMKVMLDGLAKDPEGGFWLTRLSHSPQIVRLFPFDFAYLDSESTIVQAVELPAEAMLPRFHSDAVSALILPLNSLAASGTGEGDRLIICKEEELENRIAEGAPPPVIKLKPVPAYAGASVGTLEPRTAPISKPAPVQPMPVLIPAATVPQGTGYTYALARRWQISDSTTAGALLENPEAEEIEAHGETASVAVADAAGPELAHAVEEKIAVAELPVDDLALPEAVDSTETAPIAKEELLPATDAIVKAEPERVTARKKMTPARKDAAETLEARARAADQVHPIIDTDNLAGAFDLELLEDLEEFHKSENPGAEAAEVKNAGAVEQPSARQEEPNAGEGLLESSASATKPAQDGLLATTTVTEAKPERPATKEKQARSVEVSEPKEAAKPVRAELHAKAAAAAPAPNTKSLEGAKAELAEAANTETARQARRKTLGSLVKEFLNCPDPLPETRKHPRLVQQGMVAYERSNTGGTPMEVRDMSPTGVYLRTKKRWQPGKVIAVTLQKKGAREDEFQNFVDVKARVVRSDENGVGLSWILPEGVPFDPWKRLHTKRSDESDIQFFIREIRLAKAEGFLRKICPTATDQIKHALHERLSNKRVASAVEIALKAESALAGIRNVGQGLAHAEVVMRVIENGSWIEDNWIRKMWAGLLVSSCGGDGSDRSNLPFLDLLARLTPIHLRIFSFVCERADRLIAAGETEEKLDMDSTPEELMEAADSHSFQRIQQTIGHLCNFGLFKESARPSYAAIDEKVRTRTTPTALGLKMHAHCNGQR